MIGVKVFKYLNGLIFLTFLLMINFLDYFIVISIAYKFTD